MKPKNAAVKEKEKEEKLKALRKELETELEQQLSAHQEQQQQGSTKVEVHKIDTSQPLDEGNLKAVIEALLFASSKPITIPEIRKVVRGVTPKKVTDTIQALKDEYEAQGRSFEILEIAGGYEIATQKKFAPWIMKVELQKKVRQATQSALETLAILAYKQPITRAEVEAFRGVDVSGVMSTLMERNFVKITGKKEVPGRPFLYGTTEKFLEHFGLKSLEDLPNLDEIKSIVENSVQKEELIGKKNVVEVSQEEGAQQEAPEAPAENQAEEAPKEKEAAAPEEPKENEVGS